MWSLVLFSELVPRIRIESVDAEGVRLPIGGEGVVRLVVVETADDGEEEPPAPVVEVGEGLRATFEGAVIAEVRGRQRQIRRRLSVSLPASLKSSAKAASIRVRRSDGDMADHVIRWQVEPAIVANPTALLVRSEAGPGNPLRKLTIRSSGHPFSILGVEGPLERVPELTDGRRQEHELELAIGGTNRVRGYQTLTIRTDHAAQPVVRIPVLFIGGTTAIESEGRP